MQKNCRSRTSHENFPGLFVGTQSFNEQQGKIWEFYLGCSGNHQLRAYLMFSDFGFLAEDNSILVVQGICGVVMISGIMVFLMKRPLIIGCPTIGHYLGAVHYLAFLFAFYHGHSIK